MNKATALTIAAMVVDGGASLGYWRGHGKSSGVQITACFVRDADYYGPKIEAAFNRAGVSDARYQRNGGFAIVWYR